MSQRCGAVNTATRKPSTIRNGMTDRENEALRRPLFYVLVLVAVYLSFLILGPFLVPLALPGDDVTAAFGPVGAGFLAAVTDAAMAEAEAITRLSAELAKAHPVAGAVATAYAETDQLNTRRL